MTLVPDPLRTVCLGRFTVRVYDLHHEDRLGKSALGWRVTERVAGKRKVVSQETGTAGAVYCSPCHAIDSDESLASLVALVCHAAQHDDDDNPIDPGWPAEELADLASTRWPDL